LSKYAHTAPIAVIRIVTYIYIGAKNPSVVSIIADTIVKNEVTTKALAVDNEPLSITNNIMNKVNNIEGINLPAEASLFTYLNRLIPLVMFSVAFIGNVFAMFTFLF